MKPATLIPLERIQQIIFLIRGEKVMLDADIAMLYGVATKVLNQAVKRNLSRFPEDFMFRLTQDEMDAVQNVRCQVGTSNVTDADDIRSQSVTGSRSQSVTGSRSQTVTLNAADSEKEAALRSQSVTSKRGQNIKYRPYAFTEQGVAMLSSVLRSRRAIEVNVAVMRAFVALRRFLADNAVLAKKLDELERKVIGHDAAIRSLFDAIRQLMAPPEKPRREIGFHAIAKERPVRPRKKS